MKKILYITVFCLPIFVLAQPKEANTSVYADTDWSGRHCRGTQGLCRIDTTNNKAMMNTIIVFNSDDKSVTFTIFKDKISKAQETQILGKPFSTWNRSEALVFIMQNTFVFPDPLRNELNLPNDLTTIEPGEYPIDIVKDTFIITFKLH